MDPGEVGEAEEGGGKPAPVGDAEARRGTGYRWPAGGEAGGLTDFLSSSWPTESAGLEGGRGRLYGEYLCGDEELGDFGEAGEPGGG